MRWGLSRGGTLLALLFLSACAFRHFDGGDPTSADFLARKITQQQGNLSVSAALLSRAETEALTGLDLLDQGIQPLWFEVENDGASPARLSLWSIDPDYHPPMEVAYSNRRGFSDAQYSAMESWFQRNTLPRYVPPGAQVQGFVYAEARPGTFGFTLDVFTGASPEAFTFFLNEPGFSPDYLDVPLDSLYSPAERQAIDSVDPLLEFECCASDAGGDVAGLPLNIALVGSPEIVRKALLRAGWRDTVISDPATRQAREEHVFGRPPDGVFYIERTDGEQRVELRLWLSPVSLRGAPVWLGQAVYSTGVLARLAEFLQPLSAGADIDHAAEFALQRFWYAQTVLKAGFIRIPLQVPETEPATTFDGRHYFTQGLRAVIVLADEPVGLDEGELITSVYEGKGQ